MSQTVAPPIPALVPETAPFSPEQRAWLNGFFAGLVSLDGAGVTALSLGTGALSIVANFALIPRYGMLASAWVTVISYTVIMLANLVFIWWLQTRPR